LKNNLKFLLGVVLTCAFYISSTAGYALTTQNSKSSKKLAAGKKKATKKRALNKRKKLRLKQTSNLTGKNTSSALVRPLRRKQDSIFKIIPTLGYVSTTVNGMLDYELKSGEQGNDAYQPWQGGFGAGILVDVGHSNFVFETGLLYHQMGSKLKINIESNLNNGSANSELKLEYLAIPLVAKYNFSGARRTGIFIKGGLLPSLLLDAKEKSSYSKRALESGLTSSDSTTKSIKNDLKEIDVLGTLGAGININMSPSSVFLFDASYNYGFTQITKDKDFKNEGFLFLLGAAFTL